MNTHDDIERMFDTALDYDPDLTHYCIFGTCAESPATDQPYCDIHARRKAASQ